MVDFRNREDDVFREIKGYAKVPDQDPSFRERGETIVQELM